MSSHSFAQATSGDRDSGLSIANQRYLERECVLKNSPCRDEINVYRFSELAGKPGWFSGVGSKLVNGKEISMGTLDWSYDAEKHILKAKTPV